MICQCGSKMDGLAGYDDPSNGHCHNVWQCDDCGTVCINRVWDDEGNTWIKRDGTVETIPKETP